MIRRFHALPGIVLGAMLSLIAASGAVLSLQPVIDYSAAPSQATTIARALDAVSAAQPGTQTITRNPGGVLRAQRRDVTGGRAVVTVDPLTGATWSGATWLDVSEGPVMRWLKSFHRSLRLDDPGRAAVGLLAATMVVVLASGLLLLVRSLGGWRQAGARVRASGAKGWHARIGRVALVGLTLSSLTGAWLSAASFGLVRDGTAPVMTPVTATTAPPMAYAAMPALDRPLTDLRALTLPARPGDMLRLETGDGLAQIDPATGQVAAFVPRGIGAMIWEWAYRLHTGQGLWLVGLALGLAGLAVPVLAATGTAIWALRRRGTGRIRGNVPMSDAENVILVGTEGGTTRGFAVALHRALSMAGQRVHLGDMNDSGPMPRARALIVMTATYGDGVAPASATRFLDRMAGVQPVPVAVLGFGDRGFASFCGYGAHVGAVLDRRGWPRLMPLARIDRQSSAEFLAWGRDLGAALGLDIAPEYRPALPRRHQLTLISRRDYGTAVQAPSVILRFAMRPRWMGGPQFQAGDLLGILAPGATAPRFYSLASSARDGFVEICVRKMPGGVCSGWLHALKPGARIRAFTRANMSLCATPEPVVMISAGCGIGPMAGLLRRATRGAERTLYFGLRDPASDFLYAEELAHWLADGRLTRLRMAVSRAAALHERGYVQHRLRDDAARLREQIVRGARILVCGSVSMGRAVAAEIDMVLAPSGLSVAALKQQGRYVEDVY